MSTFLTLLYPALLELIVSLTPSLPFCWYGYLLLCLFMQAAVGRDLVTGHVFLCPSQAEKQYANSWEGGERVVHGDTTTEGTIHHLLR